MSNKFDEGQSVLYRGRLFTVLDAWQVSGNWLYDLERSDSLEFNVQETQLSEPPTDQAIKGAPMLPGMGE